MAITQFNSYSPNRVPFSGIGLLLKLCLTLIVVFTQKNFSFCQKTDSSEQVVFVKKIYSQTLSDSRCYQWLHDLCFDVGHRLSGSEGAERAVRWSKSVLDTMGLDSVWLQPVMVPRWVRGDAEEVQILKTRARAPVNLNALAIGGSVGTGAKGISAAVMEVETWDDLEKMGAAGDLRGKIVFFNRPMDATKIRTFEAYGGAVDQRVFGASRAAKHGAVAVLVRSMGLKIDDFPHTGTLIYDTNFVKIPAAAISTAAAEQLSEILKDEKETQIFIKMKCQTLPDVLSYNVVGEIRGSELPNEVLLVGGHLDSWDVGHGAHDDGAGCVQSMEVLRIFKKLGYRPRRTVRAVLFMNEENGGRGGQKYAEEGKRKGEFHRCAIESDAGGFTPRGFGFDAEADVLPGFMDFVERFEPILQPYGLELKRGGGGADIAPLKNQRGLLCGYSPDSQRYFDFHHTAADVFEVVNQRELELGAASMAALVYLLDSFEKK